MFTKTELVILAMSAVFLAGLGLWGRPPATAGDYTVTVQRQAEGPVAPEPAAPVVVDLNTAGAEELETLPGIGPALARRILEYRAAHGPFRSVEELLEVKGIGEATLERFRALVTVGDADAEDTDEPVREGEDP